jgi:hypothetical protein
MGLFDFLKYDKDDAGVQPSPKLAAELRRIANLFLVSAITLILFLLEAFAKTLSVTFIPRPVYVVWGVALLTGIAVTYVYALYVTSKARRWGWVAACARCPAPSPTPGRGARRSSAPLSASSARRRASGAADAALAADPGRRPIRPSRPERPCLHLRKAAT